MKYDAKKEWTKAFLGKNEMAFPSEYVIRIFKGNYPRLGLDKGSFKDSKICDVGCGDGRNLVLLNQCGFEIYGVELTEEIASRAMDSLKHKGIKAEIKVGTNAAIPYRDGYFDFLLSWNSCYYMGENLDFNKHVEEFSRVLKKGGYLVLSIPKKTCFVFRNCEKQKEGYAVIRDDYFGVRNGEVLRIFEDEKEIETIFSSRFTNFTHGSIHDDCFGLDYHWHLVVCQKR
jgi:ubiquinone/menaquinone biosynthesis C-methylase UbiE